MFSNQKGYEWILEFGELAIGVGTLVLGIAVMISTIASNKRNRRVHLADKRKEWLMEFRSKVAELTTLTLMLPVKDKINENELVDLSKNPDEFRAKDFIKNLESFQLSTERHYTLINELMLLSFEDDGFNSTSDFNNLLQSIKDLQNQSKGDVKSEKASKIIEASRVIIQEKWNKIKSLSK